jgi:hypothetical protein
MRVAAIAIALMCSAHGAIAAGALAIGEPADVAKEGLALSIARDYATEAEASAAALEACRKYDGVPATTTALCKVVRTFKYECVVTAYDPEPSTTGWGFGVGITRFTAEDQAMQECRTRAGVDRAKFCKPNTPICDVKQGD